MVSPQHARRSFSRRQTQRLLRTSLLVAALYAGCNVYDPSLLPVGGAAGGGAAEGGAGNSEAGSEAAAGSDNPSPQAGNASGGIGGVGGRDGTGGSGASTDVAGTAGTPAGAAATGGSAGGPPLGEGGIPNAAGQPDGGTGEAGAPPAPVLHELGRGKAALASSTQTNNDAFKGNDGDTGTRWCAANNSFPQWWRVDLGSAHELASFSVSFEYSQRPYSYVIETSADDATFTAVPGTTATNVVGSVQSGVFPAGTSARYVRISVTNADPASTTWASFFEFSVLGY
jgi:hypothetical protein